MMQNVLIGNRINIYTNESVLSHRLDTLEVADAALEWNLNVLQHL